MDAGFRTLASGTLVWVNEDGSVDAYDEAAEEAAHQAAAEAERGFERYLERSTPDDEAFEQWESSRHVMDYWTARYGSRIG